MGLFSKRRGRSRSIGSVTQRPLLRHTDTDLESDSLSLSRENHVYLTQTKDGVPAFGRKRHPGLFKDFGFDMLGQSFGIPSRRGYEKRHRPSSAASQISGVITAPTTPRPSLKAQDSKSYHQNYVYECTESPMVCRKTGSIRSSSTPTPISRAQQQGQSQRRGPPIIQNRAIYNETPFFQGPQKVRNHQIPPPPNLQWNDHLSVHTNTVPITMSYHGVLWQFSHSSGYPYGSTILGQGACNLPAPSYHMLSQYRSPSVAPMSQAPAMPAFFSHYAQTGSLQNPQISHTQVTPGTRLPNIPPPPPPPPPPGHNWPQTHVMPTNQWQGGLPRRDSVKTSEYEKVANNVNQAKTPFEGIRKMHKSQPDKIELRQHSGRRTYHIHVCAGCGKKRSKRFQREHPLKRGEVPTRGYCYNCLKDEVETDDEASSGDNDDDFPREKTHNELIRSWSSQDDDRDTMSSKHVDEEYSHYRGKTKRSISLKPVSRLFSSKGSFISTARPTKSVSSAEESKSRASSPISDTYSICHVHKALVSPIRRRQKGTPSGAMQRNTTPSLRQQRYSSEDSWDPTQELPLRTRKKPVSNADNEGEEQPKECKTLISRTRSRIPRPRPRLQPRLLDNITPLMVFKASEPILDEKCDLTYPLEDNVIRMPLIPKPVEVKAPLKPSISAIAEAKREIGKQATPKLTAEKEKRNKISFSERANLTGPFCEAQCDEFEAEPDDFLREQASGKSKAEIHKEIDEPNNCSGTSFCPAYCATLNHDSEIDSARVTTPIQSSGRRSRARRLSTDNSSQATDRFRAPHEWFELLTPVDPLYAYDLPSARVVNDSWPGFHPDMERTAEEMAERDLASAGKLFDNLSGSIGGSATSTFPWSSFVTPSNISIVSYHSDSDDSTYDSAAPGAMVDELEEIGELREDNYLPKKIEFVDKKEQATQLSPRTELSIAYLVHPSKGMDKPPKHEENDMFDQSDTGRDDDSTNYLSSPIGSSLLGHTGHSV